MGLMEKIFGDLNAKEVKKVEKIVDEIEALDESMQALSDDELKAKTRLRQKHRNLKKDLKTVKLWTIFFQRPMRYVVKQLQELSV